MNTTVSIHLYVPPELQGAEELTRIAVAAGQLVLDLGYPNVGDRLSSAVVVKVGDISLEKAAKGAALVNLPTTDEDFVRRADAGNIPELS